MFQSQKIIVEFASLKTPRLLGFNAIIEEVVYGSLDPVVKSADLTWRAFVSRTIGQVIEVSDESSGDEVHDGDLHRSRCIRQDGRILAVFVRQCNFPSLGARKSDLLADYVSKPHILENFKRSLLGCTEQLAPQLHLSRSPVPSFRFQPPPTEIQMSSRHLSAPGAGPFGPCDEDCIDGLKAQVDRLSLQSVTTEASKPATNALSNMLPLLANKAIIETRDSKFSPAVAPVGHTVWQRTGDSGSSDSSSLKPGMSKLLRGETPDAYSQPARSSHGYPDPSSLHREAYGVGGGLQQVDLMSEAATPPDVQSSSGVAPSQSHNSPYGIMNPPRFGMHPLVSDNELLSMMLMASLQANVQNADISKNLLSAREQTSPHDDSAMLLFYNQSLAILASQQQPGNYMNPPRFGIHPLESYNELVSMMLMASQQGNVQNTDIFKNLLSAHEQTSPHYDLEMLLACNQSLAILARQQQASSYMNPPRFGRNPIQTGNELVSMMLMASQQANVPTSDVFKNLLSTASEQESTPHDDPEMLRAYNQSLAILARQEQPGNCTIPQRFGMDPMDPNNELLSMMLMDSPNVPTSDMFKNLVSTSERGSSPHDDSEMLRAYNQSLDILASQQQPGNFRDCITVADATMSTSMQPHEPTQSVGVQQMPVGLQLSHKEEMEVYSQEPEQKRQRR